MSSLLQEQNWEDLAWSQQQLRLQPWQGDGDSFRAFSAWRPPRQLGCRIRGVGRKYSRPTRHHSRTRWFTSIARWLAMA